MKLPSSLAEMCTFPLLYRYGEDNEPLEMAEYLQYKRTSGTSECSSNVDSNMAKLYKLSWKVHNKGRVYSYKMLFKLQDCSKKGSSVQAQM